MTVVIRVGSRTFQVTGGFPTNTWFFGVANFGTFSLAENGAAVTITATSAAGTATLSGRLTVTPVAPSFILGQNPANQTTTAGADAFFIAQPRGSAPFSYQWRKNGIPINGATNASLVVRSVTPADAGNYDVVATNSQGTANSAIATLTVNVAPVSIGQQPASLVIALGAPATFQVFFGGSPPFTFQWQKDGVNIAGATQSILTIPGVQSSDVGTYRVVVSNSLGAVTSANATLSLPTSPITFTIQPQSNSIAVGKSVTLTAAAAGTAPITYQWRKDGAALAGATHTSLTLTEVPTAAAGNYVVVATNPAGSATSSPATLTIIPAPTISQGPRSASAMLGQTVNLQVSATGIGVLAYQWRKDGTEIPGATTTALTLDSVRAADAGAYTVAVSNVAGTSVSAAAGVEVALPGRLVNLSLLTELQNGEESFALGLVLGGNGTSGTKPLLIRAGGPSLVQFGVTNPLADPAIELLSGSVRIAENDDWNGTGNVAAAIAQLGAFPFIGVSSKDAAVLAPAIALGDNVVRISANGIRTGAVLAEIYDASATDTLTAATPRLVNLSVLKPIGAGLTAGFVVGGSTDVTVLIRAIGPSLAGFGVTTFVTDPQLDLSRQSGPVVATNNDWAGSSTLTTAFERVAAFPLSPASKDAALVATLSPGTYVVQISGVGGATGTALLEIYELP